MTDATLDDEAKRATALLRGKVVHRVLRPSGGVLCMELADGTRLFVDAPGSRQELSVTGGSDDETYPGCAFSAGIGGEMDTGTAQWISLANEDDIRAKLLTSELHYGSEFRLRSAASRLVIAQSDWGTVGPEHPGRFLVYLDDDLIAQRANRSQVLAYFLRVLGGRHEWPSP